MPVIGKSVVRKDALEKAEGKSLYVGDIFLPNMLHAAVLRSPYPHAKITSIKTDKASLLHGVKAVMTHQHIRGQNIVPVVYKDMPLLATGNVRYVGEPVALVAAESLAVAREALLRIDVNYLEQPALTDFKRAKRADSPRTYQSDNIFSHHHIHRGNLIKGMKQSIRTVEGVFETPYQEHAYLETQGMLAIPQPDGSMEVIGSMQCPFYVQETVAGVCSLPLSKVFIKQTTTGGAFGGKEDVPSIVAGHAAVLAQYTNKPVKMIYRRDEDFISMSKRHPSQVKLKIGCDDKGVLTFVEGEVLLDGGAYATLSPVVLWRSVIHAAGAYVCQNVKIEGDAVATNNIPCGAYRGFGSPQSLFAIESLMDELAYEMDMDPLELRMHNIVRNEQKTSTGQVIIGSCGLEETLLKAKSESNWVEKRTAFQDQKSFIRRGIGASTIFYGVGLGAGGKHMAKTGAFLQIHADGSVQVSVGTTELGQGMRTVLSQIAADGLGIAYENVQFIDTDTSRVPDSGPTVASRATTMSGLAILNACEQATTIMSGVAADILKCPANHLNFRDSICASSEGKNKILINDLIAQCHARRLPMTFQGFAIAPETSWEADTGSGDPYVVYAYATNIVQVCIDTRSGQVTVEKIWAAHDVGKAVNPVQVEGQIQGGTAQGLGYALMEGYYLKDGIPLNPDFSNYIIPCAADMPEIQPIIVEHSFDKGPFGAKGFGEQPLMGIAPAVTNAIYNATGKRFYDIPVTPEKIWEALNDS